MVATSAATTIAAQCGCNEAAVYASVFPLVNVAGMCNTTGGPIAGLVCPLAGQRTSSLLGGTFPALVMYECGLLCRHGALASCEACARRFLSNRRENGMKKLFLILMLCTSAFGARFTVTAHHKIHAKGLRRGRALELPRMAAPVVLSIPDTFDLRGKISPILDQGQCGDCYLGTIEPD